MFGVIKAVPEAIKTWTENREQLYNLTGCAAAALVVVSLMNGNRPLESIAAIARGFGLSPIADWLTVSAPPIVASRVDAVNAVAVFLVMLLLIGMVVIPVWRGRRDDDALFGYEMLPLIGSPAAASVWVLLAVAAQHGQLGPVLLRWGSAGVQVGMWTLIGFALVGGLYLIASRYGFGDLIGLVLLPLGMVAYRLLCGILFAFFAVFLAAVALPFAVFGWMSGLEGDHSRRIRADIARERSERERQPSGASFRAGGPGVAPGAI